MLHRNNHTTKRDHSQKPLKDQNGLNYFYFDLSQKNHEVVLPVEEETTWEQLHDITWDPGRGD